MMQDIDLRTPSYQAAFHFAKEAGLAAARAAGRQQMNKEDRTIAGSEFARLLWHVRAGDGGLLGRDDAGLVEFCASDPILRDLDMENIMAGLWEPGKWPQSEFATYSDFLLHQQKEAAR